MINYMKSEWYRIIHSKEIYTFTGTAGGMAFLLNLIHFIANRKIEGFRYGTISFSFSFLVSGMHIILAAGAILAMFLFSGERKNGIMRNTVACGISREKIFLGKTIVCSAVAFLSMFVILTVYLGSACLLLDGPIQPALKETLTGVSAVLLCAVASVILELLFLVLFEKDVAAMLGWAAVMAVIPKILLIAGLKIEICARIASWMPWNYLSSEVSASLSGGYQCLWDTTEGFMKCVISGAAGILIFLAAGLIFGRRQEV